MDAEKAAVKQEAHKRQAKASEIFEIVRETQRNRLFCDEICKDIVWSGSHKISKKHVRVTGSPTLVYTTEALLPLLNVRRGKILGRVGTRLCRRRTLTVRRTMLDICIYMINYIRV